MLKRIYFVINPSSGKPEPILFRLNEALRDTGITWNIGVTQKKGDGTRLTTEALKHRYDAIVSYGGDGTVTEVAHALFRKNTPLIILPGGTMNAVSKSFSLSSNTDEALRIFKKKSFKIKKIDMGLMNDKPLLLRIETGVIADIVDNTSIDDKTMYGKLAYILKTPSIMNNTVNSTYRITVDGKSYVEKGVGMAITNTPELGIPSSSTFSKISLSDGKLDITIARSFDVLSYLKSAANKLIDAFPEDYVFHVQGKEISLTISPPQTTIFDDVIITQPRKINVSVIPKALSVIEN